jgi:glycosyltransferase involved in cell wall biosynthesis
MNLIQIPRRFTKSHWGGTESVILETSRRLLALGHPTEIHCPDALSSLREEVIDGVRVRRYPYFYPYLGLSNDARHQLDLKGGNLFSFGMLAALLRHPGLDLMHLHTGMRLGGIVRTAARLRGIPYVVSVHGGQLDAPEAEKRSYTDPTRHALEWGRALGALVGSHRVLDDAAAVLVLGRREEAELRRAHPLANIVYFPNGVDPERFATGDGAAFRSRHGIPTGDRILLCVGRLDPQKNQLLAVRAVAALLAHEPRLRLVIAGHVTSEEYANTLVQETRVLGIEDRVTIVRGIPIESPDLIDAYHAAEVFILPSIHEPFGIVILEAWASGLPVVASRVGGVPDFVRDGEDGLLVDPGNIDQVVQRVSHLLDCPDAAMHLGLTGRTRAHGEFSWDAATARLVAIYEEAVSARVVRS